MELNKEEIIFANNKDKLTICPNCKKERELYGTNAHCYHCNSDFDLGMKICIAGCQPNIP